MPGRVPRTPREGCPYSNRDVVGAVPYSPDSIRRADHSDQSRGANGVILPPAFQNAFAPGQARYAERIIATSREGPMV